MRICNRAGRPDRSTLQFYPARPHDRSTYKKNFQNFLGVLTERGYKTPSDGDILPEALELEMLKAAGVDPTKRGERQMQREGRRFQDYYCCVRRN